MEELAVTGCYELVYQYFGQVKHFEITCQTIGMVCSCAQYFMWPFRYSVGIYYYIIEMNSNDINLYIIFKNTNNK